MPPLYRKCLNSAKFQHRLIDIKDELQIGFLWLEMIVLAKNNPFMGFFTLYMMKYSIDKKNNYTLYSRLFF